MKPLEKKKDSRIDAKKMEPRTYFKTQNERNGGDYGNNDRYTTQKDKGIEHCIESKSSTIK